MDRLKKNMKEKVIVYGLGHEFQMLKELLHINYEVIGYSDKKNMNIENYIEPLKICQYNYDAIFITSEKYYEEIRKELEKILGRKKFLQKYDLIGICDNSSVRDKWVIQKLSEIEEGKILLDAGAGEMKYAKFCKHLNYISQDFGEYKPEKVRVGLHSQKWDYSKIMVRSDITNMPFDNESIDVILCTEVFEHIKNPIKALREFYRILVRGGMLILTAPFASLVHMAPYYYYSGFSRYWYEENLQNSGFEIIESKSYGNYFSWLGQEIGRLSSIGERYCGKSLDDEEQKTVYKMLNLLKNYNSVNNCSDELLCYGYRVIAVKR